MTSSAPRRGRSASSRGGRRAPAATAGQGPTFGLSKEARAFLPLLAADFAGGNAELAERFSLRPAQLEALRAELLASGLFRPVVVVLPSSFGADQLLFTLGRLPRRGSAPAAHEELSRLISGFPQILWMAAGPELFCAVGAFASAADLELSVERIEGWLRSAGMGEAHLLRHWRFPAALTSLPRFWDFSSSLGAALGMSAARPTGSELRPEGELGAEEADVLMAWMDQPLASPAGLGKAVQLSSRKAQRLWEGAVERSVARLVLCPDLPAFGLSILSVAHTHYLERRTLLERLRLLRSPEWTDPFLSLERAQQSVNCFAFPSLGIADRELAARAHEGERHGLLQDPPSVYHSATAQLRELQPLSFAGACRDAWRRR